MSMVQRYANVSEAHKADAIEKLSQTAADEAKPAEITNRMNKPVRYIKDSASA
jgi:6-phosphogluconolactonase/glucosamine-6-phosphate isomerase/deaminase